MKLEEFLSRYGEALFRKAEERFPPKVKEPIPLEGGRTPLGAQGLAIAGLVRALEEERAAFLAGEMGTGKTYVGIRALLAWRPKGRFLVLCPPHLVEKWAREVEMEGARAVILEQPKDIDALPKEGPLFVILSREKAKLGPGWRPAAMRRWTKDKTPYPACPRCGQGVDLPKTRRTACPACGEPLWQEVPPRREALAHALRRKLPKGFFHCLVLDEAHEYKGRDSAQGLTAAGLASWTGKVLLLTGTLFGGYASTLYHLLIRAMPELKERYPKESDFIAQYGVTERVYREREEGGYGYYTRRRQVKAATRERPGLSPLLLTHLLPRAVFLRLPEVADGLPPYGEEVELLEMDPEHKERYLPFARGLEEAAKAALAGGSRRLLGALVQAGLQVPDTPWQEEVVWDEEGPVARFHPLPSSYRHAKERRLLELVREELRRGRRVLVYVQGTEKRDQLARLEAVLGEFRVKALRADTVPPEEREGWIAERLKEGLEVLLTHPRVVQTGLDLVDFPTLVFYQPEYSVYTLRQAARRSWRIGQKAPVRVVFLAYRETLQLSALGLIGRKAKSSLALEGELVEGGLTALTEEDPTLALAKALAGAVSLDWKGERLNLEGAEPPRPEIVLPVLPEDRVVRTRYGKTKLKAGQPVLFL